MPEFGRCDDPSCNEKAARLFDCAHHCMKMVCLQHLIEHDRLFENTKRQLEMVQPEIKRLYSIYSSLIDEDKIRSEYEQKIDNYKKLVHEVNSLLESDSKDIEQFRIIIDKLRKAIYEKQRPANESLTIVKVEPMEEASSTTTDVEKDESLFIGFDRLQNLTIDTDYHRRKAMENANARNESENKTIMATDDDNYTINTSIQIHRISGQCPLWMNGCYGLNQEHHYHRLCRKKRFTDLSNHIRQYHGLLAPIANIISRAVHSKVPVTKRLIPNDLQVTDPRRSFFCPLHAECHNQYRLLASALRAHLIEVHRMSPSAADMRVKKIQILNKNKPISNLKNKIFQLMQQIQSKSKGQNQTYTSPANRESTMSDDVETNDF